MYKGHRMQLIFPKWLNRYMDKVSEATGISKAGVIRHLVCGSILSNLHGLALKSEKSKLLEYIQEIEYEAHKKTEEK
jgi:hypothetical protein